MKGTIRRLRPTPAMVVACIALVFALTGAGYAAGMLGPNTVGTKQLKKNAVISSKVKNRSLLAVDFKSGQLPRGPQGPQGPAGPEGPQGPAGADGPPVRRVGERDPLRGVDGGGHALLRSGRAQDLRRVLRHAVGAGPHRVDGRPHQSHQ